MGRLRIFSTLGNKSSQLVLSSEETVKQLVGRVSDLCDELTFIHGFVAFHVHIKKRELT